MSAPLLLDLFCKQGGAAMGYACAGFRVVGVDKDPQPRFPFEFVQADALEYLAEHGHRFDAIHASPPCQRFTACQVIQGRDHPDLIGPTRDLLLAWGGPYVIENVEGAPLIGPVTLCGCMFDGLNVYRERLFETSFPMPQPEHRTHSQPLRKMGRPPLPGHRMHVVGNFSGVREARAAMGIEWMTRDGLREAIPPAYTEHVGRFLLQALERAA